MSYHQVVYTNPNWGGGTTASTIYTPPRNYGVSYETQPIKINISSSYEARNNNSGFSSTGSNSSEPCGVDQLLRCVCFLCFIANLTVFFLIIRWQEETTEVGYVSIYWIILPSISLLVMISYFIKQRCCN